MPEHRSSAAELAAFIQTYGGILAVVKHGVRADAETKRLLKRW